MYSQTPIGTPSYKKNSWHNAVPVDDEGKAIGRSGPDNGISFDSAEERVMWEAEQEQLDRQWYSQGEGMDEVNDPFSGMESYTARKEEQLQLQKPAEKINAYRRARNADQDRWEQNRMLQSGAVQRVGPDDDIEEEEQGKTHLLVHHVVPPFLDGRITFTKQPDPVIPVKDPASDVAVLARKGSLLVRAVSLFLLLSLHFVYIFIMYSFLLLFILFCVCFFPFFVFLTHVSSHRCGVSARSRMPSRVRRRSGSSRALPSERSWASRKTRTRMQKLKKVSPLIYIYLLSFFLFCGCRGSQEQLAVCKS